MLQSQLIIEFREVAVEADRFSDTDLVATTFSLREGELMLVRLEPDQPRIPLGDLAQGIIEPREGVVEYLGDDWRHLSPYVAAARRGTIGRLHQEGGWINNLDVDENVTLSQRHHTLRAVEEIEAEAARLAESFGLRSLPHVRPAAARRHELRVAGLVRALLGEPRLVILENPASSGHADNLQALLNVLSMARQRGAAIIWMTDDAQVWGDSRIAPTYKYAMSDGRMLPSEKEA